MELVEKAGSLGLEVMLFEMEAGCPIRQIYSNAQFECPRTEPHVAARDPQRSRDMKTSNGGAASGFAGPLDL